VGGGWGGGGGGESERGIKEFVTSEQFTIVKKLNDRIKIRK